MLVELDQKERLEAAPLFEAFDFHLGHLGSVLLGANPGRVLADGRRRPGGAVILPADGFAYLACPAASEGFVADCRALVAELAPGSCVELISPGGALEGRIPEIFGGLSHFSVSRIAYSLPPADGASASPPAPAGMDFRWSRGAHRAALELTRADAAVGRVSAWIYRGEAEIDVSVEEAWRGRGLATLLCERFLALCRAEGLIARWTCWEDNEPSRRLAERLGFRETRTFPVHIHDEN